MDVRRSKRGLHPHQPPRAKSQKPKVAKKRAAAVVDAVSKYVAPIKHHETLLNVPGPNIITHERVLGNFTVPTPFGTFNMNPSELHQIRPQKGPGIELIQVVDPDGSTGAELVLWRFPIWKGWRIEIQGPGVYTGAPGVPVPLGARFVGVGLTKDWVDDKAKEAASVTVELKLTHEDVVRLAALAAPGAAAVVSKALGTAAQSGVAHIIGEALAYAVPVVSAAIAVSTARWAVKTCRDPNATGAEKTLAVAHAVADAVRIVLPMIGTIANVALVGVSLGMGWLKRRKQKKAEAALKTGPPPPPPAKTTEPALPIGPMPEGA